MGEQARTGAPDLGRRLPLLSDDRERFAVITLLGTIIFAVVIAIGSLDGRSGLALFGKYMTAGTVGRRPRPARRTRRGEDPAPPR